MENLKVQGVFIFEENCEKKWSERNQGLGKFQLLNSVYNVQNNYSYGKGKEINYPGAPAEILSKMDNFNYKLFPKEAFLYS